MPTSCKQITENNKSNETKLYILSIIIANEALRASLAIIINLSINLSIISYPTLARGIIVKYLTIQRKKKSIWGSYDLSIFTTHLD